MVCLSIFAGCMVLGMLAEKVKDRAVNSIAIERAILASYAANIFAAVGFAALLFGVLTGY